MSENHGHRYRLVLMGIVLVGVGIGGWLSSPRKLLVALSEVRGGLFLVLLFGLYVARPFLIAPLSIFSVFVGYRFDVSLGLPVALAGTVVTCLPPFVVSRYLRVDGGVLGWLSKRGEDVFDTTGGVRGMVAARLSPAPADAVSYGEGLSGVSLSAFVIGTIIGELPWATAYVFVGASMRDLAVESAQLDPRLLVVGAVVALILLAKPAYDVLGSED